jgi:CelD/BcsL family acetyltransferase involved in cellulose biosynthesis
MTQNLQVEWLHGGTKCIDPLADAWRALCDLDPHGHPFSRPEYIRSYLLAFEPGCQVAIAAVRRGDELLAVLPLIEERGCLAGLPVHRLRGAAGIHSGRFDLACAPGADGLRALSALWDFLRHSRSYDLIELPLISVPSGAKTLMEVASADGYRTGWWEGSPGPYIVLNGDDPAGEPWLRATSSNFRHKIRRVRRIAEVEGPLALSCHNGEDRAALERFYDLEQSGWKGKNGTAIACDSSTRRFYDEVARNGNAVGFRCYLLTQGDRLVAGYLGLGDQKRFLGLKAAYDETLAQYSPGHLLVAAILKDCAPRGLKRFDFLPPGARWKFDWTSATYPHGYGYVFNKSLYGELLYRMKFGVRPKMRAALQNIRRLASRKNQKSAARGMPCDPQRPAL